MISDEKQPAVKRALNEAFGVNQWEDFRLTSGGQSSALVFQIAVGGKPYLLKVMRLEQISDPAHEFACRKLPLMQELPPKSGTQMWKTEC